MENAAFKWPKYLVGSECSPQTNLLARPHFDHRLVQHQKAAHSDMLQSSHDFLNRCPIIQFVLFPRSRCERKKSHCPPHLDYLRVVIIDYLRWSSKESDQSSWIVPRLTPMLLTVFQPPVKWTRKCFLQVIRQRLLTFSIQLSWARISVVPQRIMNLKHCP